MSVLQARVEPETAGDPMSEQKWVRSSLRHLSEDLRQAGQPTDGGAAAERGRLGTAWEHQGRGDRLL